MAEYLPVTSGKFSYTGLISIAGVYKFIKQFMAEHGYSFNEMNHTEQTFEDGKHINLFILCDNKVSDNAELDWEISLDFTNCQEVSVELEGRPVKMHKGNISLSVQMFQKSNYDKSFEQNAFQYFIRTVLDKYVVKSYLNQAKARAKKDFSLFMEQAKSYINLEKFV